MKTGTLVQLLRLGNYEPVEGMIGIVVGFNANGRVGVCWCGVNPDEGNSWPWMPWGRLKVLSAGR